MTIMPREKSKNLFDALSCEGSTFKLLFDGEEWSSDRLRQEATALRQHYSRYFNLPVALSTQDRLSFVLHLVALDGWVSRILLLPSSISKNDSSEILQRAGISDVLGGDEASSTPDDGSAGADSGAGIETRWVIATSGTTSVPKLIDHTLNTLTRSVSVSQGELSDLVWGTLYEFDRFAGLQVFLQALFSGATLVECSSRAFVERCGELVREKVTALSATPSMWRKLIMQGDIKNCRLKQITLGGEIADGSILSALRSAYGDARIVHIYASTEAGVGFSVSDGLPGFPATWLQEERPVELRIGGNGNLLIRTQLMATCEAVEASTDAEGFFDTGDIVRIEGDRVVFMGRSSGAINVGGLKVLPEEVECVIREVPGVDDVVVTAKESALVGQIVSATVVPSNQDRDSGVELKKAIRQHCASKLQKHKWPALVTFSEHLETSDAGKLRR